MQLYKKISTRQQKSLASSHTLHKPSDEERLVLRLVEINFMMTLSLSAEYSFFDITDIYLFGMKVFLYTFLYIKNHTSSPLLDLYEISHIFYS